MNIILILMSLFCGASLLTWCYLMALRGSFWKTDQQMDIFPDDNASTESLPTVCVLIPARNESEVIEKTLPALLEQHYTGDYHVYLIDDCSTDETGEVARNLAQSSSHGHRLTVITGKPIPPRWTGKLWALQQGIEAAIDKRPQYFLFTDADIIHPPVCVSRLVEKSIHQHLSMVSLMVKLHAGTGWERLLIPAFGFFFAKLYPFRWVNDPLRNTAAAAGGCILIKREVLEDIGGLGKQSTALIDDVVLADRVKNAHNNKAYRIWLGLTRHIHSIRHYEGIRGVWHMVARTAYHQLKYSPLLLMFTIAGMLIAYLIPLISVGFGMVLVFLEGYGFLAWWLVVCGLGVWLIMAKAFFQMTSWYEEPAYMSLLLPLAGAVYTLMTVDSAVKHYRGRGGLWKGRVYNQ